MRKSLVLTCVLALLSLPSGARPADRPNIVIILTDDQRRDELTFMPNLQALAAGGVSFTPNAVISDPLCCPSRATILTGTYSHTNFIYANGGPYGGFGAFTGQGEDQNTIATVLHAQGYRTGLIGKYLNGYAATDAGYIPPGWDDWFATAAETEQYYNWSASDNGTSVSYGADSADYSTDVFFQKAVAFAKSTPADEPLFLYVAPHAPHKGATPSSAYAGSLAGEVPDITQEPSFNEADVSDKPKYVRATTPLSKHAIRTDQAFYERQFETLRSVDDGIGSLESELQAEGRLENTLWVFLSDQGIEIGEHRLLGKDVPYEESIRTPLIMRWNTANWALGNNSALVGNVDLAPTLAEAAGTTMPGAEGTSLLPTLADPSTSWRSDMLLEHRGGMKRPSFCGVRTSSAMYAQYATGEEELYDLSTDPWEDQNQASNPAYEATLN